MCEWIFIYGNKNRIQTTHTFDGISFFIVKQCLLSPMLFVGRLSHFKATQKNKCVKIQVRKKKNAAVTRPCPLAGCKLETWVWALSQGQQAGRHSRINNVRKRKTSWFSGEEESPGWRRRAKVSLSKGLRVMQNQHSHILNNCGLWLPDRLVLVTITARGFTSANEKQYSTQVKKQISVGTSW